MQIIILPFSELCEAYYLCVNGDRQEPPSYCPEGLYFDVTIGECNLAADVDCEPQTTTTTTTEAPTYQCPDQGVAYIPYQGNCTLYILCIDGSQIIYRCPTGTLFDTSKLVCEDESTAVCTVGLNFAGIVANVREFYVNDVDGNEDADSDEEFGFAQFFRNRGNLFFN